MTLKLQCATSKILWLITGYKVSISWNNYRCFNFLCLKSITFFLAWGTNFCRYTPYSVFINKFSVSIRKKKHLLKIIPLNIQIELKLAFYGVLVSFKYNHSACFTGWRRRSFNVSHSGQQSTIPSGWHRFVGNRM